MHVNSIIRCCSTFLKVKWRENSKMFFKKNFRKFLVIIFTPFILGFFVDSSDASNQCKTKVLNFVMKQCSSPEIRNRRDLELKEHRQEKRQVPDAGTAAIISFVYPLVSSVSKVVNGALNPIRALAPSPPTISIEMPPYPVTGFPGLYIGNSPPQPKSTGGLLTQEASDGGLRFELSKNEAEELYAELSERLPRQLKNSEETQKMLIRLAAECCGNPDGCSPESLPDIMKCV